MKLIGIEEEVFYLTNKVYYDLTDEYHKNISELAASDIERHDELSDEYVENIKKNASRVEPLEKYYNYAN